MDGYISSFTLLSIIETGSSGRPISAGSIQRLFDSLGSLFTVSDIRTQDLRKAQKNMTGNFLLALATALADKEGADYLITARTGEVKKSKVKIISPQDFIDLYAKKLKEEAT